ncbi:hypothetical protein [Mesorhizobium sp. M00.F.Ca.ET.217.01.1.1]|uniref:hypothetical protein n=1 Tax=Mesorhizobium sp. M00.F.Ca.ET.217.01.1.1 TaxID=2500529 RepID=UPI000FD8CC34|nr:hypothetical protein [Mesorhizobium sp. M00.F.Ca.ET.217.01.1.1]TGQ15871.1 hypothetical protein EN860_025270 [Mesorhizobium sp. M00.F.Ca.ET.217.01.1.1]TGQ15876.1 hypothetical protein EN860_025300 [Mesorhizobium sp. M00.F.Ca.ET.217.01.1.1]
MTAVTSSDISEKIGALDSLVRELDAEFDKAATQAVAGVDGAGKKAAYLNERIERLGVDRHILSRALTRAQAAEAAAREAKAEAARRNHFEAARGHAARLLAAASRIDAAIAEIAAALPELSEAELSVRLSLSRADHRLPGAVVGQVGLALMSVDKLNRLADGRARLNGPSKTIAETCAFAWNFLLAENGR